ncbi:MAG: energy transducer TonB [Pyrinomonadaceae bacterium]
MKWFGLKSLPLALLILALPSLLSAQSSVKTIEWESLRPDGEDFSVQMPKGSTSQSGKEPYHKFELNMITHIAQVPSGPAFAVVSLSGIKSNPAMYTETERLNSYVDAFKNLFPSKLRKGAVAKLTLVGEKVLQGNSGREYRLTVQGPQNPSLPSAYPALSGTARVFATRKRFYAAVFLNTEKDDEAQEQFLSSFQIPERIIQPATVAAPNPPPAENVKAAKPETAVAGESPDAAPEADATETAGGAPTSDGTASPKKRGPISGGVLNGKALSLPQPDANAAKAAGVAGVVVVRVTIDEQGNVISAVPVSGPAPLHAASVSAALQARFAPTLLVGEPVQVTGIITYNFVKQ